MTDQAEQDEALGEEEEREPRDVDDESGETETESGEESELERLRGESEAHRDKYLRLAAELDNLRKRSARELENARKYGVERFAEALLPVIDSLEAGLAAEHVEVDSLLEGQKAILRLLEQAFESVGVAPVDPHGEPFDPNLHEAMSMLPSPHAEPDSVVDVIQKGYVIKERLLRPARVVVATAPATESEGDEPSDD